MSDPISLAGTAIGVVSLGLSVCQGLISYYSTFRDCPRDAANMLEKLEGLKDVLEVLEGVLQSHDNLRTETAAVYSSMQEWLGTVGEHQKQVPGNACEIWARFH